MKKNTTKTIEEHDLLIYPIHFVPVIGDMEKEVNEYYEPYDGIHNYIGAPKAPALASTYNVRNKNTKDTCLMIWIPSSKDYTPDIIAHECTHAALEVFKKIGAKIDVDNQEPFAYLIGTLTRLTHNTLQKYSHPTR